MISRDTINKLKTFFQIEGLSRSQINELVLTSAHTPHIRRHRAEVVIGRVRLVAAIFAVFVPAWMIIDLFVFDWPVWFVLAVLRVGSGIGFVALAWPYDTQKSMTMAYFMLAILLSIPPAFYLISRPFLLDGNLSGMAEVIAHAYSILPFVVVAGLSLFPLTALEALLFAIPALMAATIGTFQDSGGDLAYFTDTMWLMTLVIGASLFSGVGQLHYLITLVNKASIDALTGAFTRRSGEELIDLQFRIAARQDMPLAVGFVDVDKFKSINDEYGHEEGDKALQNVAGTLRDRLRRSDTLIRWGGEEFVLLLPNTNAEGIKTVVERIDVKNLGKRPDGNRLTASMGIAELKTDKVEDWPKLIEAADERMYYAKTHGRSRCIGFDNEILDGGD